MYSLYIRILSIALVAMLALATIYYGGDAFSRGGDAEFAAQSKAYIPTYPEPYYAAFSGGYLTLRGRRATRS